MIPVTRGDGGDAMGLRDEKKRQTRTAILEGALARFRQVGFDATRVRDITAGAADQRGDVLQLLPVEAVGARGGGRGAAARARWSGSRGACAAHDPVPDRLEDLMEDFVADFAHDRELAALLGAHTTFFSGFGSERLERARELLTEMFATGQRRGEIRADVPSSQLAQLFLELMLAMIRTWVDEPDDSRPLAERLRLALSILLRGCIVAVGGDRGRSHRSSSRISSRRPGDPRPPAAPRPPPATRSARSGGPRRPSRRSARR